MNSEGDHECPAWNCHPTPAQLAEMDAEARQNSRQLLNKAIGRYPHLAPWELAKLFGWSEGDVEYMLEGMQ